MGRTFCYRQERKGLSDRAKRRRYTAQHYTDPTTIERSIKHWKYIKGAYEDLLRKDAVSAEKKLLKLLKKDPKNTYALSKLISIYASWSEKGCGTDRFEDAERLCEKAVKLGIDSPAVASAVISVYGKLDKFDKAWDIFLAAVNGGYADSATYNSMMRICSDKGDAMHGKVVFNLAKENNISHLYIYSVMIAMHFNRRAYTDAIRIIEEAPQAIRNLPSIKVDFFESHRKLKNYEKVIKEAGEFLSGYGGERFDDDFYIQARTVRAYCMMHSMGKKDAISEFVALKNCVKQNSMHYPRILCGYVFCRPELTDVEREQLIAELDFFTQAGGNSMHGKIINALKILGANDNLLLE